MRISDGVKEDYGVRSEAVGAMGVKAIIRIQLMMGVLVLMGSVGHLGVVWGAEVLTDGELERITARGEHRGEEEGSLALPKFPIDPFSLALTSARIHQ